MNPFQLVLKQMRQRALGTWLTLLSVVLGVALAVSVLLVRRGGESLFGQTDYGYDLIVGKGSPLQLVLNTVYLIEASPGNVPYSQYEQLARDRRLVKHAIPIAVGDTYKHRRIIGTLPQMFGFNADGTAAVADEDAFHYRPGKHYEFAEGTVFQPRKFEAVIGSDIPKLTGLKLGDSFKPTHGGLKEGESTHEHDEQWKVVGVLKQTHTATDRALFIPLVTTYCIEEHEKGMEAQSVARAGGGVPAQTREAAHEEPYTMNADGTVEPKLPKDKWLVSAILVKARAPFFAQTLQYGVNAGSVAVAVSPAFEMSNFFNTILAGSALILLLISGLVSVVAAVSILVSIYNAVSARKREIAIMRALGATRSRVLMLICLEAGLIGLVGGALGCVLGHVVGAGVSGFMDQTMGQGFNWLSVDWGELAYLAGVVVLAVLAGFVPAMKAYRTPVATNLVAA